MSKVLESSLVPAAIIGGAAIYLACKNKASGVGSVSEDENLTIYEIFELRKNGEYERAYFSAKKNFAKNPNMHYTTLCMFWTSIDYARYLQDSGKHQKAVEPIKDAKAVYSKLQDLDNSALSALYKVATRTQREMSIY